MTRSWPDFLDAFECELERFACELFRDPSTAVAVADLVGDGDAPDGPIPAELLGRAQALNLRCVALAASIESEMATVAHGLAAERSHREQRAAESTRPLFIDQKF